VRRYDVTGALRAGENELAVELPAPDPAGVSRAGPSASVQGRPPRRPHFRAGYSPASISLIRSFCFFKRLSNASSGAGRHRSAAMRASSPAWRETRVEECAEFIPGLLISCFRRRTNRSRIAWIVACDLTQIDGTCRRVRPAVQRRQRVLAATPPAPYR